MTVFVKDGRRILTRRRKDACRRRPTVNVCKVLRINVKKSRFSESIVLCNYTRNMPQHYFFYGFIKIPFSREISHERITCQRRGAPAVGEGSRIYSKRDGFFSIWRALRKNETVDTRPRIMSKT